MPDLGGGYQMNPQQAKLAARNAGVDPDADQDQDNPADAADSRATAEEAGYMELGGAQKDSDCATVNVPGGVSSQGGCCNLWDRAPQAASFSCGTCTKITQGAPGGAPPASPDAGMNAQQPMTGVQSAE